MEWKKEASGKDCEQSFLKQSYSCSRCSCRVTSLVTPSLTGAFCSCCQSANTCPLPTLVLVLIASHWTHISVLISNPVRSGTMSYSSLYSQPGTVPWHILGTQWMMLTEDTGGGYRRESFNGPASGLICPGGIHSYIHMLRKHVSSKCERSDLLVHFNLRNVSNFLDPKTVNLVVWVYTYVIIMC